MGFSPSGIASNSSSLLLKSTDSGNLNARHANPALTVTDGSKPMEQENIHAFSRVDQADDPQAMVRFLETVAVEYLSEFNARSFALLQAAPGRRLLDLGCGNGRDACALTQVAGEDWVVGVDKSEAMLAEARRRAAEAGLKIEFQVGDAQHLNFDDASFDGVRSSRLLCHIANPVQALNEMVRVLRPNGQLVCIEPDHETLVIASADKECTRKIVNCFCDGFMQGWTGRMTPVWMREAGLREVRVEAHTMQVSYEFLMHGLQIGRTVQRAQEAGIIQVAQAATWLKNQQRAAQSGLFFAAITLFMATGQKT